MKRKKLAALGLIGILALSAVGCKGNTVDVNTEKNSNKTNESEVEQTFSEEEQSVSEDEENQGDVTSQNDVRELLEQVLEGKKSFLNTDDGGKECYLNNFKYFDETQTEKPLTLAEYAIVDIDQDGEEEAVVSLDAGFDGAFEILRCSEGIVYGYQMSFRSINTLYDNGYCLGNSGASTWDIYELSFTKTSCIKENVAGCNNGNYYLEGEEITSSQYDEFAAGLTEVQWTSFQSSNGETAKNTDTSAQSTAQTLDASLVGETSGTIFFYEDDYLTEQDVKYMPKDLLRIARNEIYAKHGYIFETEDLKEFFSYKEWYQGTIEASDWDDSVLNDYEKKNLELISKFEKEESTPLEVSKEGSCTRLTDGEFVITLPSVWNENNYYVTKGEDEFSVYYYFISKNNAKYGFGGHVFTLIKSTQVQDSDFSDNFIELGKYGNYYYYMGQSTDVQYSPESSVLAQEWRQLSDTYNEIADTFVAD